MLRIGYLLGGGILLCLAVGGVVAMNSNASQNASLGYGSVQSAN